MAASTSDGARRSMSATPPALPCRGRSSPPASPCSATAVCCWRRGRSRRSTGSSPCPAAWSSPARRWRRRPCANSREEVGVDRRDRRLRRACRGHRARRRRRRAQPFRRQRVRRRAGYPASRPRVPRPARSCFVAPDEYGRTAHDAGPRRHRCAREGRAGGSRRERATVTAPGEPLRRPLALAAAARWCPARPQAQFYWPWQQRPRRLRRLRRAAPAAVQPAAAPARRRPGRRPGDASRPRRPRAEAEQPEPPPPPYEPQLLRLSEILGALAFLRPLCGGNDERDWRARMTQLIDAEASDHGPSQERLGRGLQSRLPRVRPDLSPLHAGRRAGSSGGIVDEGGKLARELASRYGG